MRLSTLFNFLRGSSKPANVVTDIVHLWEDNYCQVELLPTANKEHVLKQIEIINNFSSEEHGSEQGYTEVYERDRHPFTTKAEEVNFIPFRDLLVSSGLKPAEAFYYEGEPCTSTRTKVFGFSSFAICVDIEDGFINNIWLITGVNMTFSQLKVAQSVLYKIGETYDLLLVDWNSLDLVDLKNNNKIKAYLKSFLSKE